LKEARQCLFREAPSKTVLPAGRSGELPIPAWISGNGGRVLHNPADEHELSTRTAA
jgi:hypothetical protein